MQGNVGEIMNVGVYSVRINFQNLYSALVVMCFNEKLIEKS